MKPVERALCYIEKNLDQTISLADIAANSHVSQFHLSRAFAAVTGYRLMQYVRCRRLTRAVKELVDGAPDILTVALNAGYGSHEAFTRAFYEHFDLLPSQVRVISPKIAIRCVEALDMSEQMSAEDLLPPKIIHSEDKLIVGLSLTLKPMAEENKELIQQLKDRFSSLRQSIPKAVDNVVNSVIFHVNEEGFYRHAVGVEVREVENIPKTLEIIKLPQQKYAIFTHQGNSSDFIKILHAIWGEGLTKFKLDPCEDFHLRRFGDTSGEEILEAWIPVR